MSAPGRREPPRMRPRRGATARSRAVPSAAWRSAPRSMALGTHRRRRRRRPALAGVAVLGALASLAIAAVWIANRPVSVTIAAAPPDAAISLAGATEATGSLEATGLAPGVYRVTVSRAGFATRTVDVTAERLEGATARIALDPLPQRVLITAAPGKPTIQVFRGEERVLVGKGKVTGDVLSGDIRIVCSAEGRNEYVRELFLDRPASLDVLLDPKGQIVHCRDLVECSGAPKGVALTPDGREMWTTILNGPPSIEVFSTDGGRRLFGIDLGEHGAVEIIFNRAGTLAYASQMETARVFEIDARSRRVLRSLPTESSWTKVIALSPDEKTLYAANWSGDDVSEIDLVTGKVRRRIPVADTPRGLWPAADGESLYVAGFGDGSLQRIDLASGKVTTLFRSGGAMRHLVADEKRGVLFASDMAEDCVYACDMKTGKVRRFADVGHKPNTIDLSPDGRVLFVSNRGENNAVSYYLPGPEWGSILMLDAKTGRPLDGVVGGNQCTALDVSNDGSLLVFSDFLDDTLRVYEVPKTRTLLEGDGGRAKTLAADVVKRD